MESKQDRNLELYTLIWCQDNIEQTEEIQLKLRDSINYLKTFQKVNECYQYIKNNITETLLRDDEKIILIVSIEYVNELMLFIHEIKQIIAVYIFSPTGKGEKDVLQNKFTKIKAICKTEDELIREITNDQTRREQIDDIELSFDIYDPTQSDENPNEKSLFLWFRLLIDALIKIEDTFIHNDLLIEYQKQNPGKQYCDTNAIAEEFTDKYVAKIPVKNFVHICKQHFAGNEQQLTKIDEFEATYEPSKSIFWYTRESFVYRVLNKALRYQNIDNLYQYRFIIRDIFNELEKRKYFSNSHFHLYRGQAMLNEEFQRLTRNSNQILRINSFLSTSKDKQIALGFAMSSIDEQDKSKKAVLFDIEIDTQISETRPYADISDTSQYQNEAEVLFMCGIVFQLKNVTYDKQMNVWLIELKLCSEQDYELKTVYEQLQQQYLSDKRNLNLIDLGNILKDFGNDEKAEKYYIQLLNTLNDNDPHIQRCLHNFGILAYRRSDFDEALEYLQKALDLELESNVFEQSFIRSIYTWIGNVYFTQNKLEHAYDSYNEALKYKSEIDCRDRIIETGLYANIANIYTLREQYDLALEKHMECLKIKLSFLNAKDPKIAASKVNIGIIYRRMKQYQNAIEALEEALNIQRETLPPKHAEIAATFVNIGLVYEELHDYNLSYKNYKEAANIFSETNPYMPRTLAALSRIEYKMKQATK